MMGAEEYVNVRTDIAELRGLVTGNLQALQANQARHEEEIRGIKTEFDDVHRRQNKIDATVAAHGAKLATLELRDGRKPAYGSLAVALLSLVVTVAAMIQWA